MEISDLFHALAGHFEYEREKELREWERASWIACQLLQPHLKKGKTLKPSDLINLSEGKEESNENRDEEFLKILK